MGYVDGMHHNSGNTNTGMFQWFYYVKGNKTVQKIYKAQYFLSTSPAAFHDRLLK